MLGGLSLATEPLFLRDPEEIVREFQSQAQEGAPLTLVLFPEEWPPHDRPPERLTFSKDSILLDEDGIKKRVSFEQAVSRVAVAQLLMRHAAVFARAIQRLKQERGLTTEEALLSWACWEHGYDRFEEVPDSERKRIQIWAEDARDPLQRGEKVLSSVQEEALQVPSDVSAWILRPPSKMGLQWPPAPQEVPDQTNLWEWLAVPPDEILRALAQAATQKKRVTLILPGKPVAMLDFHADGRLRGSYDEGGSWKTDNWKENEAGVIRFLAEEKAILRRAVVRAVAYQDLVKVHGLEGAAHLLALAEYGFAELRDVPKAGRFLIQDAATRHLEILRNGMHVLEIGGGPAAGSLVLDRKPKDTTGKRE
jgi:hypothetical protein